MTVIEVAPGDVVVLAWDGPEPDARAALAAAGADPEKIDVFAAEKIAPVGLATFLSDGHGVDEASLTGREAELDALSGVVVVVPAFAFEDGRGRLEVTEPGRHVATFRERKAPRGAAPPLESESAKGTLGSDAPAKPPKSEARISGMVALGVLLFLAVFVIVFVLMAG